MLRIVFLSIIFLFSTLFGANAKNPSSAILVKGFGDNTLVFYRPSKMPRASSSAALSDMVLDVTISTINDSASIKSTHYTSMPLQIDSVIITSGNFVKKYPIEKIFVESRGRKWEYRLCFNLSKAEFIELTSIETPPVFSFGSEHPLVYADKNKSWNRRKNIFNLMLQIIDLNDE